MLDFFLSISSALLLMALLPVIALVLIAFALLIASVGGWIGRILPHLAVPGPSFLRHLLIGFLLYFVGGRILQILWP